MTQHNQKSIHPGIYIKENVLPDDVSVKQTADLLGIGRPALSNFLNGNSTLSAEMAIRLEKAFNVDKKNLLDMQSAYDQYEMLIKEKEIAVRAYVPDYLDIHARQIEAWADGNISARSILAALLRRLINTTGQDLKKVDFPAYDNSQKQGWDGYIESGSTTPWIPIGLSGWEFGTNVTPTSKANSDYDSRTQNITEQERKEITFVFVTPRNWNGKEAWLEEKNNKSEWKQVLAYDANDLEQWLEQSIPTQNWFAEQLGQTSNDLRSLEQCWRAWASVTNPELNEELFRDDVQSHEKKLSEWLTSAQTKPLLIAADSKEEGLAFLSCALNDLDGEGVNFSDNAVVALSSEALIKISKSHARFIQVLISDEVERTLPEIDGIHHVICIRNKSQIIGNADIVLGMPSYSSFSESLKLMGINDREIDSYLRDSGQSPTILRRILSEIEAIKFPAWSQNQEHVKNLIPLMFAGVWNNRNSADREVLMYLCDEDDYNNIENSFAEILTVEESPLWSVSTYRGVVSKIDSLFLVGNTITEADLERFFDVVELVLSEDDPALDLPEDKRWMASVYEKTREHSSRLRESLCETLVLISSHGNNLFQKRLGIDVKLRVSAIIENLLTPLDSRKWMSQKDDLPNYAEAAPEKFLRILTDDINSDKPEIHSLLEPSRSEPFGSGCARSGLLWALETLAWNTDRLTAVVSILAKLSEINIDDNWSNKPINTLQSIFRSWMPQTSAPLDARIKSLQYLVQNYPDIGWEICMSQLDPYGRVGHYNNRPKWNSDAVGFGESVTVDEDQQFRDEALEIIIGWPEHNENTLGEMLHSLAILTDKDTELVWQLIKDWVDNSPKDSQKAILREKVRKHALTRRWHLKLDKSKINFAQEAYAMLLPDDLVLRHQWLFDKHWVEESFDELEDEDFDHDKRDDRITVERTQALEEIYKKLGYSGIDRLVSLGEAEYIIGWIMAKHILDADELENSLSYLLCDTTIQDSNKVKACVSGLVSGLENPDAYSLITQFVERFQKEKDNEKIINLLLAAPFEPETWDIVDGLSNEIKDTYWKSISIQWASDDPVANTRVVDELMNIGRPQAAFSTVRFRIKNLESKKIVLLLREIATKDTESPARYEIKPYEFKEAFDILNSRKDLPEDELASLEFLYLQVLKYDDFKTPSLERMIEKNPLSFVQALAMAFKRRDGGNDPEEWFGENPSEDLAIAGYSLLGNIKRIPGTSEDGTINQAKLRNWVVEARQLASTYGRQEIGDQQIGQILSSCSKGDDGIWPCTPVRQVIEEIGSENIAKGISIGIQNSRGVTSRGMDDGGDQERELANTYREWSKSLAFEYPYVSSILERIAQSYDREAERWDNDHEISKRTGYR